MMVEPSIGADVANGHRMPVSQPPPLPLVLSDPPHPAYPHADAPTTPMPTGAHGAAAAKTRTPAGATVFGPDTVPDGSLNPRSCVICRKRKVKCDHLQPCTNCRRAHISCVFPAPGRAPRRPRPKDPNDPSSAAPSKHSTSSEREAELMKRLRKLEGIVEELSGQIELETARQSSTAGPSPEAAAHDSSHSPDDRGSAQPTAASFTGPGSLQSRNTFPSINGGGYDKTSQHDPTAAPVWSQTLDRAKRPPPYSPSPATADVSKQFGRLVLHDKGKSRYVSSGFWSKINDEINELRAQTEGMLESDSDYSDMGDSPAAVPIPGTYSNSAFLFGYRSSDVDLRKFHPLPSQIPFIWQVFRENVTPVTKILHTPTTEAMILQAKDNLDNLDPSLESLLFAIYLGAVTSMTDSDVEKSFGASQAHLLQQYRFALEMALAKAEFITSSDIMTLQALTLFVMLVRRRQDTRFAWTMTGLAVRISQSVGLHRDPSNFPNLTPFEGEMRRRLFWYVALLDLRAAEDQGTDLAIHDQGYDTRRPLNINDADFGPDSEELPPPREGETEMAFVLMSYEVQPYIRRIMLLSSAAAPMCQRFPESLEEREQMLAEITAIADRLRPKEGSARLSAVGFLAALIVRVILSKMTILVYQTSLQGSGRSGWGEDLSPERRSRLLVSAIEVFEYGHMVSNDARVRQWRWVAQVFMQWQAAAYLLLDISSGPWSPISERGWLALSTMFGSAAVAAEIDRISDNAAVWLPFKRLYMRAKRHRDAEIARLRADPAAAMELYREWQPKAQPESNFGTLSGRIKIKMALEKWRVLVHAPVRQGQAELQKAQRRSDQGMQCDTNGAGAATKRSLSLTTTTTTSEPYGAASLRGSSSMPQRTQPLEAGNMGSVPNGPIGPEVMQFMDQVMAHPTFASEDVWHLAFTTDGMPAVDAAGGFAFDPTAMDPVVVQLPSTGPAAGLGPPPPPPSSSAPLVDELRGKDGGSPWMWTAPSNTFVSVGDDGRAAVSQAATVGQSDGISHMDELDMSMDDDDFNWQTFNDNIRGFSGSEWGPLP